MGLLVDWAWLRKESLNKECINRIFKSILLFYYLFDFHGICSDIPLFSGICDMSYFFSCLAWLQVYCFYWFFSKTELWFNWFSLSIKHFIRLCFLSFLNISIIFLCLLILVGQTLLRTKSLAYLKMVTFSCPLLDIIGDFSLIVTVEIW